MAPTKSNDAFVWQQFVNLGRPKPSVNRSHFFHPRQDFSTPSPSARIRKSFCPEGYYFSSDEDLILYAGVSTNVTPAPPFMV